MRGTPVRYRLVDKEGLPKGLEVVTQRRGGVQGFHRAVVETPYGEIAGWAYAITDTVHHGTDFDSAIKILDSGYLKVGASTSITGGYVTSFTSNPRQFNGSIRFIFRSKGMQLEPMVYADFPAEVDKGFAKEAQADIPETQTMVGINRVRAFYGVQPYIFKNEMESFLRSNIGIMPFIERVEYWIPYRFGSVIASADSTGVVPKYANITDKDPMIMIKEVQELRAKAEEYGIPFVVKSTFRSMHLHRWHEYAPLDGANLNLIKEGILPEATLTEAIDAHKLPFKVVSSD